ncbi:MAG: hypothetical protein WA977_13070, partial [Halobacteriota archaeon]
ILSTDEALDANEAVNSYQERDDHREVVSHSEDVGGTSLAKQVLVCGLWRRSWRPMTWRC